jgi:hypothetical protein
MAAIARPVQAETAEESRAGGDFRSGAAKALKFTISGLTHGKKEPIVPPAIQRRPFVTL